MRYTKLYNRWCAMKSRCNNPNDKEYSRYGGRGIRICKEWQESFENFYKWSIENGYKENLSIDRIDNNKNYYPGNCRWTTRTVQNRNYSRNQVITYNGKTQCVTDWANEIGINPKTLYKRIAYGFTGEKLFSKTDLRKN